MRSTSSIATTGLAAAVRHGRARHRFVRAPAAAPSVTATVHEAGRDERDRDRELDQHDHAEAGRERDREKGDEERGGGVLKQVAASAREVLRASPAVERGSRWLWPRSGLRCIWRAAGGCAGHVASLRSGGEQEQPDEAEKLEFTVSEQNLALAHRHFLVPRSRGSEGAQPSTGWSTVRVRASDCWPRM